MSGTGFAVRLKTESHQLMQLCDENKSDRLECRLTLDRKKTEEICIVVAYPKKFQGDGKKMYHPRCHLSQMHVFCMGKVTY